MNNNPWDVISVLESDNSRLFKERVILDEAVSNNDTFFEGVGLALNAMITFGLKQIPFKEGTDGPGLTWGGFRAVADRFIDRSLTGNAARQAVETLMNTSTLDQWNDWYRRILIKDLRCGTSEKTINTIAKKYPKYAVPVFTVQLAHDGENHPEKIKGKKLLSDKLDGVRCVTIVYPDGRVNQFSRNGKELLNFEHIKSQFAVVASSLDRAYVFDGEVMSSSFQTLMKQVHRKDNVAASDAVLYLFDVLPLSDFEKGIWKTSQTDRSAFLADWYSEVINDVPNVQVLEQELVDLSTDVGRARFNEINNLAIAAGKEGIMIKDPNAPYELKRSVAWLKKKPVITLDLMIVGLEEGTGKNEGRLGALICQGEDNGKNILVNCGSGFSDNQRIDIWTSGAELIGQVVEVKADAVTQNQDGSYSLRFPRFERFRGFVPGEKI